ncbi:hypothetical protein MTO96_032082 [Rhipicephalus appendiculatus]
MSVDLSVGAVPILYKEVHSLLNPNDRNEIDRELFGRLLTSTNLPKTTLDQVGGWVGGRRRDEIETRAPVDAETPPVVARETSGARKPG